MTWPNKSLLYNVYDSQIDIIVRHSGTDPHSLQVPRWYIFIFVHPYDLVDYLRVI